MIFFQTGRTILYMICLAVHMIRSAHERLLKAGEPINCWHHVTCQPPQEIHMMLASE